MITLGSLFDGIGGFPLAAIRQGITPLWASEIESFPIQVTKHHFPETLHMGDIIRLDGAKLPPVYVYAVETAIQLHIAELTEPLRELYVTAYTLPSTSAYLYRSTAKRLEGIFGDYLPDAEAKDFYEMEIASAGMMRSFMAVPCDVYFTVERKIARFLECALKLYNVPVERRREVTAAVLQLDLHAMAAGIIRTTVQQAEKGFEAVKAEPAF